MNSIDKDSFELRVEKYISQFSTDFQSIVKEQFSVVRKLFEGNNDSIISEIPAFVETYVSIFKTRNNANGVLENTELGDSNSNTRSVSSTTAPLWMKDFLQDYRSVLFDCFNEKGKSLHVFVTEVDLRGAHQLGMAEALGRFREHVGSLKNAITDKEDLNEETLRLRLEQEFAWVRAVNTDKYGRHVDDWFHKEFDRGKKALEAAYTLEAKSSEKCNLSGMREFIESHIKRRLERFHNCFQDTTFPVKAFTQDGKEKGIQYSSHISEMATKLRAKLEQVGCSLMKNMITPPEYQYEKCLKDYRDRMKSFLDRKSLSEAEEIKEENEKLTKECVQRWKEHFHKDGCISSSCPVVLKLEQNLTTIFTKLWDEKSRVVQDKCVRDYKAEIKKNLVHVLESNGIPFEKSFIAKLPVHAGVEELIRDKVEAVKIVLTNPQKRNKSDEEFTEVELMAGPSSSSTSEIIACSRSTSPSTITACIPDDRTEDSNKPEKIPPTASGIFTNENITFQNPSSTPSVTNLNLDIVGSMEINMVLSSEASRCFPPAPVDNGTCISTSGTSSSLSKPNSYAAANHLEKLSDLQWSVVRPPIGSMPKKKVINQEKNPEQNPHVTRAGKRKSIEISENFNSKRKTMKERSSVTCSQSFLRVAELTSKWKLIPIPNHDHLKVPRVPRVKRVSKGKRRKSESRALFHESVQSFGIALTENGFRAGIAINSIPHMLVEATNDTAQICPSENTIFPLLIGLTSEDQFIIGNDAKKMKMESGVKCKFIHDISKLFYAEHTHLSKPIQAKINGKMVTFQLEFLLGMIFYKIKTIVESLMCEMFKRSVVDINKVIISIPAHLETFQMQQIGDATFIAGFKSQYVAILCESSTVMFDFARRLQVPESGILTGNAFTITQYSKFFDFDLYNYCGTKTGSKNKIKISPIESYRSDDVYDFLDQISQSGTDAELQELISQHVKTTSERFPQPQLFVLFSAATDSDATLIRNAITGIRFSRFDEYASIRGVTSIGNYGYWLNSKSQGEREVDLTEDRCIKYRSDSKITFEKGNLSNEECAECNQMLIDFISKTDDQLFQTTTSRGTNLKTIDSSDDCCPNISDEQEPNESKTE